jgi:hypothetical protein
MRAPAATVIAGVSLAIDERRLNGDRFDIALSPDGIEIRRPGQVARQLSWDHVSEWEIEERRGGVLLTLRGGGSVTPLMIPRWTVDELDAVLRDVMARMSAPEAPEAPATATTTAPEVAPEAAPEAVQESVPETAPETAPTAASRREPRRARRRQQSFARWKVAVTVTLLAVVATAVTLVLLQSAGVIHLSFLGPTA